MVDSISGIGRVQTPSQLKNNQDQSKAEEKSVKDSSSPVDKVQLSEEAISLSQAEKALSDTRTYLEENPSDSLATGKNVDSLL